MIKIETIIDILKKDHNFREIIKDGHYFFHDGGLTFDKISYDSRNVTDSTLFFVKGENFKKEFLEGAVESGLKFYISESDFEVGIPVLVVNDIKQAMSLIAMEFYGNPQDKLKILAFTGTKGKTTSAYFAYQILSQSHRPALLSTMNTTLDGKNFFKSSLTTPESLDLFKMMAQAVANDRTHLIMEVSSQAYLKKRVYGLTFDASVFLNISPDHIGPIEHPTFEDYFYNKRLLMENSRAVVVNSGMDHFQIVKEQVSSIEHDFYGENSSNTIIDSQAFSFEASGKLAGKYDIQLIGRFNQENALAAGLACLRLGASLTDIQKGIALTRVPGRMEVLTQKNGAKVFVDYAHNGDSLTKLLSVVQEHQKGQTVLVLGATGNKGESRRKDFGILLNKHPEIQVILTADDPNREDPVTIAKEIASYISHDVTIIADRAEAIKVAMSLTEQEGDAVILAGKGADAYQIVHDKKVAYLGDYQIAENYL
ncbi:UDP-N-acetylmuramoyl-L-alanyl-D-glutamate--L-lysine ligase [Streptococcus sp. 27098_8_75]|jgi:UDP-N-acetylmuramoyl-L-alanyl-D-glutamate--L-lysine ligase|uniref:UDP-N-acetylmuramoyl-L-alanyl-D-glutamate--L- lysine ligase n=1 Tax=Streptococcus TaxID=1301 RepID=UPI0005F31513|nr:UDP-N-acetylmuramoyl-L-alanyl-D-glutamate--L-lysine ligase [Streptococcus gordonii]KJU97353.1 UDP-N-acetylmuramoylalanyl-D-glutamate--L-lysine ligase [Streptococcus gordonii]MCB6584577.1 UDP-N-acetylmuramoyl-L-alanyl-D-glutamate--L-lysine ligase [Streptococcus gordonii]MCB7053108.1 UDP-N-acetylmuramoyl-L-alanyl-D-glutamate--L-lysine ligase [Streptococcus gordonii]MCB7054804.1 UDP-N-acetylmuramoyl-L-alanyl-D-glutamate--L-lysine ligase [Streptococcus gordonii]MCC3175880.1 UDP-N-acetylmuramyl-